jgi:hypothetical protein
VSIPVYSGHPAKTKPVAYVTPETAAKMVADGRMRGACKGKALQFIKKPPPKPTRLSCEGSRIIEIAQFQQKSCQGGLINPR